MRSWRSWISTLTFAALFASLVLSIVWISVQTEAESRLEPSLTFFAVLASITGIFFERWASALERRKELFYALSVELKNNEKCLGDEKFKKKNDGKRLPRIYPRLLISAVNAAIGSDTFAENKDRDLLQELHLWRDSVCEFNRRLELIELRTFIRPSSLELALIEIGLENDLNHIRSSLNIIKNAINKHLVKLRQPH